MSDELPILDSFLVWLVNEYAQALADAGFVLVGPEGEVYVGMEMRL